SESLKAQVFDALRHIAQGFLDYPRNQLQPTPETLATIYSNSLIVLYRLLFVLYAEARELLPLRESPAYRDQYSLYGLVRDVSRRLDSGVTLLTDTGQTWARLRDLFGIINAGSPPLKVATFNGGLFDPQRHAFLDRYSVGDAQLQLALDKLARIVSPQTGLREFIDYRDLAERHLGTIYEGLLEYHLEKDEGGRMRDEESAPAAPPSSFISHPSSLILVNDKGERHRTGSYYTPDFVVQYIVEQTLRPVLDAAVGGKESDAEKIAAVLAVNCVDPAMGSGHFPVAAMEYIARYLVELGVYPPAEAGDEADLAYWKRRVAQSCIYGVDLNPLAVDLAKLSLWLATAAKGRPLSFLDHHLRCGNALVGARASDLDAATAAPKQARRSKREVAAAEVGQLSLLDDAAFAGAMMSAVGSMWLIEGSAGRTVDEVKEQEKMYEHVRRELTERFALHADLRTAANLGQGLAADLQQRVVEFERRSARDQLPPALVREVERVRALAAGQRFFHWDLEFPEVFYDRHGRPLGEQAGFDAVIGNPPYVRQEQLSPLKPYFQQAYAETASGTADLFVYFFHQGVKLLRAGGLLGYIASNSWLRANYATPLRAFMRQQVTVVQLIDLGDNRVFADAPDVYPAIPIVRKAAPPDDHTAQAATFSRGEGVRQFERQVAAKLLPVSIHDQQDSGWQLGGDATRLIFKKLMGTGMSLEQLAAGRLYRGILTGLNEAFIIDQQTRDRLVTTDPACAVRLKPVWRGEDLNPWCQENEGRWLIVLPARWTRQTLGEVQDEALAWAGLTQRYPALAAQLAPFADAARKRLDKGEFWWELRSCDYYAEFEQPKIVWPDIAKYPRFSWDDTGGFTNDKGFFVVPDSPYILGVLQSRALWLCIAHLCVALGERAGSVRYQQKRQFISRLPIPDAPDSDRQAIGDLAMAITAEAQARYGLHRRARYRILSDLGAAGKGLNQKLTAWWELDFPAFRAEVQKVFKRDIALRDRDDWEEWLGIQREQHRQRTAAIIAGEVELNRRVYQLFDLSAEEIRLIEESTKYQYGEV
ncbi:MAG: Eco57I restriction-modification methylase domain-containing protein, partial [Chloroflexales bacterium]